MWVDGRIGPTTARKLLNGKVPNLTYPISGQEPCQFNEGEEIIIEIYRLWIRISKVEPRHGKWRIEYVLADYRPNLLGKKVGYTHNPQRALRADYTDPDDVRHDELEATDQVEKHPAQERNEMKARLHSSKLENLKGERRAHARRLETTESEISRRLLPRMMEKLDREIAELERDGGLREVA